MKNKCENKLATLTTLQTQSFYSMKAEKLTAQSLKLIMRLKSFIVSVIMAAVYYQGFYLDWGQSSRRIGTSWFSLSFSEHWDIYRYPLPRSSSMSLFVWMQCVLMCLTVSIISSRSATELSLCTTLFWKGQNLLKREGVYTSKEW